MIELTSDEVDYLMEAVRNKVKSYMKLPEADDLLAEAYLGAWQQVTKLKEEQRSDLYSYCCIAGVRAIQEYLRSNRCAKPYHRRFRAAGKQPPGPPFSLEQLMEEWDGNPLTGHSSQVQPRCQDFAPDLIDRIAGQQFFDEVLSLATERQRGYIRRVFLDGEMIRTIAAEEGLKPNTISEHIESGLDSYRFKVGVPVKCNRALITMQKADR